MSLKLKFLRDNRNQNCNSQGDTGKRLSRQKPSFWSLHIFFWKHIVAKFLEKKIICWLRYKQQTPALPCIQHSINTYKETLSDSRSGWKAKFWRHSVNAWNMKKKTCQLTTIEKQFISTSRSLGLHGTLPPYWRLVLIFCHQHHKNVTVCFFFLVLFFLKPV